MKYYLIAGEASGDLHGSHLIQHIRKLDPQAEFRFWGGDQMEDAAGRPPVKHYRDLAFMGFVEVVANLRTILRNMRDCKADIESFAPDRLVLIDYPGFNLRIAKWAKPAGYDVSYYISPQLWAWHSSRVKQVKKFVDRMLCILPFEPEWYAQHDYRATFVGHPLLDVVRDFENANDERLDLPRGPVIALLPGSRKQEIKTILPIMLAAAVQRPKYHYVLAQAPAQEDSFYDKLIADHVGPKHLHRLTGQTYALLHRAHAAWVTSGTATLETALFRTPLVVAYKGNQISYQIAKRLVDIKYISLVNLVLDEPLVTELIQGELTAHRLVSELDGLLDGPERQRQLDGFDRLYKRLGDGGAAHRAARQIVSAD